MRGLDGKSRFSDDGPKHRRNKTDLGFHLLVEGVSAQKMETIYFLFHGAFTGLRGGVDCI